MMLTRLPRYAIVAGPVVAVLLGMLISVQGSQAESLPPTFVIFSGSDEVEAHEDFEPLGGEVRLTLTEDLTEVVRAELRGFEMIHAVLRETTEFTLTRHSDYSAPLSDRRFTFGVAKQFTGMVSSGIRLEGELSEDGTAISGTATWVVDGGDWFTREFRVERTQGVYPRATERIVSAVTYTDLGPSGNLLLTVDDSGNLTSMSLKGVSFGGCSFLREPSQLAVLIDDPQPLNSANSVTVGGALIALTVVVTTVSGSLVDGVLSYRDLFGCEITIEWTTGEIPATASPTITATSTAPAPTSSPEPTAEPRATKTPPPSALPQTGTGGRGNAVLPTAPVALALGAAALFVLATVRRRAG